MSHPNKTQWERICMFFVIATLLALRASARRFHSRDIHVSAVIARCEEKVGSNLPPGSTICQATLGCILRSVGAYTTARWSAGASILAFIPTITAVMSNSIEEIVEIAEEDSVLAVMLGLCSVTVFASRFGSNRELHMKTTDAIYEHVFFLIDTASKSIATNNKRAKRRRNAVLCIAYIILVAACGSVWFPTVVVLRNGVVVFSCPWQIHVPLWIGLTQAVVLANIFLRRYSFEYTTIHQPRRKSQQDKNATPPAKEHFKPTIVLRSPKAGFKSKFIRGYTSTVTFALYAFATAIFGAMTMFTASDAVWCMVLFAFAAGMGRVVANLIIGDHVGCRRTIVVDVQERQVNELKARIECAVRSL